MGNPYKQLTLTERYQIQSLCGLVFSARRIDDYLHRSNKTVSLELKRCPPGAYDAEAAHRNSLQRRKTATKFHKRTDSVSRQVKSQLSQGFTPEQIAGRMKLESFNGMISCQTIYRLIKKNQWRHLLPCKEKRYRQRKWVEAGARLIPNRVDIEERLDCVDLKEEVGHWEGGYRSRPGWVSFADHESITRTLGCKNYFAKPYHSWQRGFNENTNGLLRRLFPKGMKIGGLSRHKIDEAQFLINIPPRKALNYFNPIEFLSGKRVSLMLAI